ncbi:MAG: HAD-IA family hydrolase [Eubacteriales bacterium]|jgi:HAD superfamily hydrolase (TIGR01549 family)|nr:HAD-IA family hydrolase [Eubacteriales bacterium]MDD4106277.1 HAD-IA family hydrolase [Eubacteriales bacterium]MDD4711656.1 HAD-IA family hydrolase [Eubacteriales bacterium]NLO15592.1 HAD-IA family hydrolase [Clostridiales bacterium]
MQFKHWFWDFDGTLYDTYPRVTRAFQNALRDAGIILPDDVALAQVKLRLDGAALWAARGDADLAETIMRQYYVHSEKEDESSMRPYAGAKNMLEKITRLGGKNYLYTHRNVTAVDALKRDDLWQYFHDKVTSEDAFPAKPAPDALNHLIHKHQLAPQDCCMVGDRSIDLDAGKNAGITDILFDPDAFYEDYPATYRFSAYADMSAAFLPKST